ncbi:unnamed protein product [Mytilus coruscus]|uniref:OTU domain-containing protein n=1 Tax=Mytilus coruscus TaxID=42192 RepID=A0A6J8C750_MYTCO|nr:unnamed protein product [Mytilus coruscus]
MKILMLQHHQLLKHTAEQLINMTAVAVPEIIEDKNVSKECHRSFLSQYIPVHTQARGNCLWEMISIGLCNKKVLMKTLRVLTAYTLLEHQIHFEQLLAADRSIAKPVLDEFDDLTKTALTNKAWGNEYHLYALSIILQRPIYIYSTFKINIFRYEKCNASELKVMFDNKSILIGRHLKYIPDSQLGIQVNSCIPLCGFFRHSHYTAVLPRTNQSLKFIPQCSILP